MRAARWGVLVGLVLVLAPQTGSGEELRIAAWNLEHLDDSDGAGCVGRSAADYEVLARRIAELDADIVAFQEVEDEAAAHRVFPASDWHVEVSRRPPMEESPACWDRPQEQFGHLATGFAIRRGVQYRRHGDLTSLGADDAFQRWATDIAVTSQGLELRLLSVHLRTGCWGAAQDDDSGNAEIWCNAAWPDRGAEGVGRRPSAKAQPFVILGDFNRRLALADDWAWRLLSPASAPLLLLTKDAPFRCDPRFPAFIDHMVAGGGAETMLAPGSFREESRRDPHPDHCAMSAVFRFGS